MIRLSVCRIRHKLIVLSVGQEALRSRGTDLLLVRIEIYHILRRTAAEKVLHGDSMGSRRIHSDHRIEKNLERRPGIAGRMCGNG